MFKNDAIVWEIVAEAFWLVALVAALVFGLINQPHPTTPRNDQSGSGAVMLIIPKASGWVVSVEAIRIDK